MINKYLCKSSCTYINYQKIELEIQVLLFYVALYKYKHNNLTNWAGNMLKIWIINIYAKLLGDKNDLVDLSAV